MNPAYSVILFTTASGTGYGLLALACMVALAHGPASSTAYGLSVTLTSLILITAGLLSSTLHLGHPERAWRAFSQWRTSWLSREGVAAIITYAPALGFAALWSGLVDVPGLLAPLAVATLLMCLITVITTGMIYASLKTIRRWNHWLTPVNYITLGLAGGALALSFLSALFGRGQMFLHGFTGLLLVVAMGFKFASWLAGDRATKSLTPANATGLAGRVRQWEVPHTSANYVMKEMGYSIGRKHAAKLRRLVMLELLAALALMALVAVFPAGELALTGLALVLGGLGIVTERWLFFAEAQHAVTLYYGAEAA